MCNLYRMEDKDWVNKSAHGVESLINLMPAYQMNPNEWGPIVRNTADGRKQLVNARWGLPAPRWVIEQEARKKAANAEKKGKPFDLDELIRLQLNGGTTNVRKLNLPH